MTHQPVYRRDTTRAGEGNIEYTQADLREIRERWGDLLAARMHGSPILAAQLVLTAEQIAHRDELLRQERAERLVDRHPAGLQWMAVPRAAGSGESPAPLRVPVEDVVQEVTGAVLHLEATMRRELGFTPIARNPELGEESMSSGRGRYVTRAQHQTLLPDGRELRDVEEAIRREEDERERQLLRERLQQAAPRRTFLPADREWVETEAPSGVVHWACVWLEDYLPWIADHPRLLDRVQREAARLVRLVRAGIGELQSGLLLQAPCPWCRGVDEDHPDGALSMRLYTQQKLIDSYVLCHGKDCDPPESDCGGRFKGKPWWPSTEFDWLAGHMACAST